MTFKEHLGKALEKMPPSVWRDMLRIVYNHACNGGSDVKPLSGGNTRPPKPPQPGVE